MKNNNILEKFRNKLRILNYSKNTIKIYCFFVEEFLTKTNKDSYNLTHLDLNSYLNDYNYTSTSKQNQVISSLKKFYEIILNKKEIHLNKIKRPKREKRLPQIIDKEFLLEQISRVNNLKHRTILSLAFSTYLLSVNVTTTNTIWII